MLMTKIDKRKRRKWRLIQIRIDTGEYNGYCFLIIWSDFYITVSRDLWDPIIVSTTLVKVQQFIFERTHISVENYPTNQCVSCDPVPTLDFCFVSNRR